MSQNNFVVRDVAYLTRDEHHHHRRHHHMSYASKRTARNFWTYIFVIVIAGGVGYFAVNIQEIIDGKMSFLNASTENMESLRAKYNTLSDDQKEKVRKQYGHLVK
jgi:hypothetical protein